MKYKRVLVANPACGRGSTVCYRIERGPSGVFWKGEILAAGDEECVCLFPFGTAVGFADMRILQVVRLHAASFTPVVEPREWRAAVGKFQDKHRTTSSFPCYSVCMESVLSASQTNVIVRD